MENARPARRVAIVLPYREAFAPASTGAIGLLVHGIAAWRGAFETVVYGPPPPTPPYDDADFRPVRATWWWPGPAARRYGHALARMLAADPPAVVEVHNRPDLALALARGFPGAKVALFLHNDPRGMRGARTAAERARLLERLAVVAACSAHVRGLFLEGVAAAHPRAVVLHNWIDLAGLPVPAEVREKVILFAGRVVADKGADSFVAACGAALPRLPGWRGMVIGGDRFGPHNPDTPWLRALRGRAREAGVEMAGYRPQPEVAQAMARAAIVVVPSRWAEPFGLTALEAMAGGAALMCSLRGGLAEVCGTAAVAIDPEDPAGMAEAMVALAGDPARRAALGAAGRAQAARFDLPQAAARLDGWRQAMLEAA